jgi:hypothetical protein
MGVCLDHVIAPVCPGCMQRLARRDVLEITY